MIFLELLLFFNFNHEIFNLKWKYNKESIALNDFVLFDNHGILILLTSQQWSDHCGKYNRGISKIRISIIVSGLAQRSLLVQMNNFMR